MNQAADEFGRLVGAVLRRFYVQNGQPPPPDAEVAAFGANLWSLVLARGLPRPLAAGERGEPGGMSEAECAPLVANVLAGSLDALRAEAARQLVKACFYPEFTTCRDSYRQVLPDGTCRRQQLARVRGRVSGTHCVDCPHWVALAPEVHAEFLAAAWHAGAGEFTAQRAIFLPEDFRALRLWLQARARRAWAI